ncbi:MAG: ParA family protein [Chloroflexota bacterium]
MDARLLASMAKIITIAAAKGGVGKTTIAYELAAALHGVLLDLDWDSGGATRMWGYDPAAHRRAPLLDALESGRVPQPRVRPHQPALVPAHPDLASSAIPSDLVADALASWAERWATPYVVVDTHPGANPLTDGAMQGADAVIVPVVLAAREMDALDGMLADLGHYTVLLAPNLVPPLPPRRYVERLAVLAGGRPVAPVVSEHRWLRRRLRRAAVTLQPNPGAQVRKAAEEFCRLAAFVEQHCG